MKNFAYIIILALLATAINGKTDSNHKNQHGCVLAISDFKSAEKLLSALGSCQAVNFAPKKMMARAVPKALAVLTKGLHRECASETKVPEAVITKGQIGEFSDQPEFKCYLKCLLAKLDLISESNEVDYDGMIRMLSPDIKETGTKMINDCRGTTGMDSCDTAYNLNTCLYNSNPVEYFLV